MVAHLTYREHAWHAGLQRRGRVSRGGDGRKFERSSIIEPANEELEDRVMTEIIRSSDSGNSPKNKFVEDLEVAFAQRDTGILLDSVANDIYWNIVGETPIRGKDALKEAI